MGTTETTSQGMRAVAGEESVRAFTVGAAGLEAEQPLGDAGAWGPARGSARVVPLAPAEPAVPPADASPVGAFPALRPDDVQTVRHAAVSHDPHS